MRLTASQEGDGSHQTSRGPRNPKTILLAAAGIRHWESQTRVISQHPADDGSLSLPYRTMADGVCASQTMGRAFDSPRTASRHMS